MTKIRLFIFTFTIFLLGIMELIISGLIEMIRTDINISYGLTGQLITVYALSFAIFGPILIYFSQRFKMKTTIRAAFIIFIIGNLIFALGQNFLTLVIGRVIIAMGASVLIVIILDLTSILSKQHQRAKMIALVYMGFSAANVFGIPLSTLIGSIFGWREVFFIIIILSIITAVLLILNIPNQSAPTDEDTENVILSKGNIVKYITVTLFVLTGNFIIIGYISPILTQNGYTLAEVSLALFIAGLGGMSGTFIGGGIGDKFNIKKSMTVMLILFMVSAIIIPFTFNVPILFYVLFYLFNLFEWSTSPMIQSGLVESVKGSASNVFSWNMSSLNLGIGLGAFIGGIFINLIDAYYLPFITAIFIVIAIIVATRITDVERSV